MIYLKIKYNKLIEFSLNYLSFVFILYNYKFSLNFFKFMSIPSHESQQFTKRI